jgi:hypothetical protein
MPQIPQQSVDSALQVLSALDPMPLALYWEYQDVAATVLFVMTVAAQSQASVEQTYSHQIEPRLCALIPETGKLPAWMVVFQDQSGQTIGSCFAQNLYGAL